MPTLCAMFDDVPSFVLRSEWRQRGAPPPACRQRVSMDTRTGTTTLRHNRHHDMLIVPTWNSKGCKRELVVLCPAASSRRGGGWAIEGDYGPRSSASPASLAFSTTADMSPPLLPQDSPAFPLPPDFSASLSGAQSGNYFLLTDQETAALMHEAQGAGFDPFDESELEFMHYVE